MQRIYIFLQITFFLTMQDSKGWNWKQRDDQYLSILSHTLVPVFAVRYSAPWRSPNGVLLAVVGRSPANLSYFSKTEKYWVTKSLLESPWGIITHQIWCCTYLCLKSKQILGANQSGLKLKLRTDQCISILSPLSIVRYCSRVLDNMEYPIYSFGRLSK